MLPREPLDEWEWYVLMQHYGLPTRLLDWTEAPLTALYFALESVVPGKIPCVWILDPVALNRLSGCDYICVPKVDDWTQQWLPRVCGRGLGVRVIGGGGPTDNRNPLAVFPKRYNPRIVAQRGTFTVHGANEVPLDRLKMQDASGAARAIERVDIDPSARDRIWQDLWAIGITRTAVYPEPQSLAEDLKRQYEVR